MTLEQEVAEFPSTGRFLYGRLRDSRTDIGQRAPFGLEGHGCLTAPLRRAVFTGGGTSAARH